MTTKPVKLELNNSGAWKTIGSFDAAVEDSTDDILLAAEHLVQALNAPYSGRKSMTTLRVRMADAPHTVLMYWESAETGWWRDAKGEPA